MNPDPAALIPSGRQSVITAGNQRLVVVEVGGGIRRYTVAGEDVLDGYDAGDTCSSARGQLLVPWPNRLAGGSYQVAGETYQTPLSEPEAGNAIHGLVRFANWVLAEERLGGATLAHRLHPQPGYPWLLDVEVDYRLDDRGLAVAMSATNRGSSPCPYGAGAHPYLRIGEGPIDDLILTAPGATYYEADGNGIPVTSRPVEGTAVDFRSPRAIGATQLNTAFTDLRRHADGRAAVELAAGGGRSIRLWLDEAFAYLMLFTGDSIPDPARRRRGLGVEPMTCAPNAFRSGDGLTMLEPGQRTSATWGITVT